MTPHSTRRALAAAALSLPAAWLLAPHAVPLYDGIGFPDDPYRYVTRPAGDTVATRPPLPVRTQLALTGGTNPAGADAVSIEQGPQVAVFLPPRSLHAPAGTARAVLTATPVAPDAPTGQTADGVLGNVYRVTIDSDAGPVPVDPAGRASIDLRAPIRGAVAVTMVYRTAPDRPWTLLATSRIGMDIFEAALPGPGDYAVRTDRHREEVAATTASPGAATTTSSGGGAPTGLLVAGGVVVLVVVTLGTVRLTRRGRAPEDPPAGVP